jgi:uncharacterized protein DUF402
MLTDTEITMVFAEGATVVRRDILRGKVWSAIPHRVVADSGDTLVLARWPGVEMVGPATWIEWLRTGDNAVRRQAIPNLAAGQWELGRWTWRDTTVLNRCAAGEYFSVSRSVSAGHGPGGWYVNFELPYRRTAIGIDTFDLLLDLVVEPDLSGHAWKDEDEYAHARRLGLISDSVHHQVEQARLRVLGLIETGQGPFAGTWAAWRRDPGWPVPALPADALTSPAGL